MSLKSTELLSNQFWNVNLPVVEDPRAELDIVLAQPEPQMLAYDFTQIQESSSDRPEQEKRTIKYASNYQQRPRSDNNDVAKCFAGNITASRLSISLQ
jgi:broad specificity polyphosphatase/5'/3'-nucleotidase SurE